MPLPEKVRTQAQLLLFAFCQMRVPESIRNEYRLAFRIRENTVTLYESTGSWQPSVPEVQPEAGCRVDRSLGRPP